MRLIQVLVERGYLKLSSREKEDKLIAQLKILEKKLSPEEFETFENLLFTTFETVEDDFFELGRLVGEMLEAE
ncbi:hypothetical protein [Fusobacterium necrophorum]|uniref:hypothetical protein n=1 Tax=Fusobacterium necrophorum TaxID=859 RepID=UPI000245D9C9|nr:hypothetical protein [Fusobacterium necrophorum]EHO21218.1 hypothetical protein HMPREF9466_00726 [Fusobacterium necrophorum subsp. funduliforme 1_1_36S]AVQ20677.1 hypothetical protein C4N15_03080 [Fusobacterium necrophorum subsp. funduliforme]KYM56199.1 hypothetical protein A2U17_00090 [Fusobacterium necrophorum subsp. funduliforme]KYM57062.1 hypothetical protein A2U07_01425 [Fusobacterium necrophorum subsp. funduliforme]MDK4477445.1 hypothetical protein [Fusobacterium necrophorum]